MAASVVDRFHCRLMHALKGAVKSRYKSADNVLIGVPCRRPTRPQPEAAAWHRRATAAMDRSADPPSTCFALGSLDLVVHACGRYAAPIVPMTVVHLPSPFPLAPPRPVLDPSPHPMLCEDVSLGSGDLQATERAVAQIACPLAAPQWRITCHRGRRRPWRRRPCPLGSASDSCSAPSHHDGASADAVLQSTTAEVASDLRLGPVFEVANAAMAAAAVAPALSSQTAAATADAGSSAAKQYLYEGRCKSPLPGPGAAPRFMSTATQ